MQRRSVLIAMSLLPRASAMAENHTALVAAAARGDTARVRQLLNARV